MKSGVLNCGVKSKKLKAANNKAVIIMINSSYLPSSSSLSSKLALRCIVVLQQAGSESSELPVTPVLLKLSLSSVVASAALAL